MAGLLPCQEKGYFDFKRSFDSTENTSTTDGRYYYFSHSAMKIVIIEDERDLGVLMRNFLVRQLNIKTPEGNIRVVASLTEGMDCVKEMSPDWIFIDNNLPDGKGVEAIKQIREVHPNKQAKVVMMSAMTNLKEEAFKNGADYFLDKPISFVEVKNIFTKPATDL